MASDLKGIRTCLLGKVALAFAGALMAGVALAAAAALVVVGSATGSTGTAMAVPRLRGTIGPGFTISLKRGIARVRLLKAGRYAFVVADKSSIHNFTLNSPGATNRTITGTSFVGTETVTLTLKKGTYRFYCTVHPTITGTFKVARDGQDRRFLRSCLLRFRVDWLQEICVAADGATPCRVWAAVGRASPFRVGSG